MKNNRFFAIWGPSQASQSQNGEDVEFDSTSSSFWLDSIRGRDFLCLGRVPQSSEMRKIFVKMKRSRRVHNPRYQELYSAPRNKKVVMISMWEKKPIDFGMFFSIWDFAVVNLILGLPCLQNPCPHFKI